MFDGRAFGAEMVGIVKGYVSKAIDPILKRLDAIERSPAAISEDKVVALIAEALAKASADQPQALALTDVERLIEASEKRVAEMAVPLQRVDAIEVALKGYDQRLMKAAADAVAAIPAPAAGKDADPEVTAALVRSEVAKAVADLPKPRDGRDPDPVEVQRMVAEAVAALPPARDGKDAEPVDPAAVKAMLAELVDDAVAALPRPQDGKSITAEDVRPLIEEAVSKAVAALPKAKDGRDADMAAISAQIDRSVAAAVAALPAPKDGQDGYSPDPRAIADAVKAEIAPDIEALRLAIPAPVVLPDIEAMVRSAVAALPAPRDGASVTVDDVAPMVESLVAKAVSAIPRAKDGVGFADAIIDRDGMLVFTLSDGSTKRVGHIVGRDADMAAIERSIAEKVASIPRPRDGVDGVGFDDMDISLSEDERTLTIAAEKGETRKVWRFALSHVLDRGVFELGKRYVKGDGVTFGGSFFVAQRETADKPTETDAWRLAVKRGRDAKEPVKISGDGR